MAGGLKPPLLSRILLHSGNFPERTEGNSGNFSNVTLLIRADMLQPPKFLVLLRLCSHVYSSLALILIKISNNITPLQNNIIYYMQNRAKASIYKHLKD